MSLLEVQVGMADPAGQHPHQHLAWSWIVNPQAFHPRGLPRVSRHHAAGRHSHFSSTSPPFWH
jgi:hypothetical protein